MKASLKLDSGARLFVPLSARYLSEVPRTFGAEKEKINFDAKNTDLCKNDVYDNIKLKSIHEDEDPQSQAVSRNESSLANNSKDFAVAICDDSNGFTRQQKSPLNMRYECLAKDRSKSGVLILERKKQLSEVNYTSANSSVSNNNSHLLMNASKISSSSKQSLVTRNNNQTQPTAVSSYNNFVNPSPKLHPHHIMTSSNLNISNELTHCSQVGPVEEDSMKTSSGRQCIDREKIKAAAKSISISIKPDPNQRSTMYCRTLTIGDKLELNNISNNSQSNKGTQNLSADQLTGALIKNASFLQGIKKQALEAAKQRVELMKSNESTQNPAQTTLEKIIKARIKVDCESERTKSFSQLSMLAGKDKEKSDQRENPFKKYYRETCPKASASKEELRNSVEHFPVNSLKELERENEQLRSLLKRSQDEAARTLEERNKLERDFKRAQEMIKVCEKDSGKVSFLQGSRAPESTVCKKRSKSSHLRDYPDPLFNRNADDDWDLQILETLESSSRKEALQNLENLIRDHKYCLKFLKSIEELMRMCSSNSEDNKENIAAANDPSSRINDMMAKKLLILTKSPESLNNVNTKRINNFHEAATTKNSDRIRSPATPADLCGDKSNSSKSKLKEIWKWVKCLVKDRVKSVEEIKKTVDCGEVNQKLKQLSKENEAMSAIIKKINAITGVDWTKGTEDRKPIF